MPVYVDADTGEEFTADQLDPSQYDIVGAEPPKQEPGWLDAVWRGAAEAPVNIARAGGGVLKGIEDNTGFDVTPYFSPEETIQSADYYLRKADQLAPMTPGSQTDLIRKATAGAVPFLTMAPLGGGALAPALMGGTQAGGEKYANLSEQGVDPITAAEAALASGAVNTGLGLPLFKSLGAGGSLLSKMAIPAAIGGATAPVGAAADMGIDAFATGNAPTPEQIDQNLAESAQIGALTGGLLGAGHEIGGRAAARFTPQVQLQPNVAPPATTDVPGIDMTPRLGLPPPPGVIEQGFQGDVSGPPMQMGEVPRITQDAGVPLQIDAGPSFETGLPFQEGAPSGPPIEMGPNASDVPLLPPPQPKLPPPARYEGALPTIELPYEPRILKANDVPSEKQSAEIQEKASERPKPYVKDFLSLDEAGSTRIFSDIASGAKNLADGFKDFINEKTLKNAADRAEQFAEEHKRNPGQSFMAGEMKLFGRTVKEQSETVEAFRRWVTFPSTFADKVPEFRGMYDTAREYLGRSQQKVFKYGQSLHDYMKLPDKSRVNEALDQALELGPQFQATDEALLRGGLSPEDIKAFRAVRSTMDMALEDIRGAYKAKAANVTDPQQKAIWDAKVDAMVNAIRVENYVPRSRQGQFYAIGKDAAGKIVEYTLHNSKAEAQAAANALQQKGAATAEFGVQEKMADAAYEELPPDLVAKLKLFNPETETGTDPRGFATHLVKAKGIKGYSKDFHQSIPKYLLELSNFASRLEMEPQFQKAISAIDPKSQGKVYDYAARYKDYILSNTPENQALRKALAVFYLGGNVKSAFVNLSQMATMTYPQLARHTKNPARVAYDAMKKAGVYLSKPEAFAKANPDLADMLQRAVAQGDLEANNFREFSGFANGRPGTGGFSEMLMKPFGMAEKLNRTHAFIAGYDVARANGMKGEQLFKFAEDFVNRTQFDYTKANRPEYGRGKVGAPAFLFKAFTGNWIRALRNSANPQDIGTFGRMVAMMTALGGANALPLVKDAVKGLQAAGYDPNRELRKAVGSSGVADALLFGIPDTLGLGISGAIGFGELAPDFEQGPEKALFRFAGGVPAATMQRAGKAWWLLNEMDSPYRAAEQVAPEFLRNPMVAYRAAKEGFRTPTGKPLVSDPTPFELGSKALGFTPPRLRKAYEDQHTIDVFQEQMKDNDHINLRIARALFNGDREEAQRIVAENEKDNQERPPEFRVKPTASAVKRYLLEMQDPKRAELKSTPKKGRRALVDLMEEQRR